MTIDVHSIPGVLRNVATFAAGAATTFGVLSVAQSQGVVAAITQVSNGLGQIIAGVGALAGIIMPIWVAYKSSKAGTVATVQAQPDTHVVTTDPAVKQAVPGVTLAPAGSGTIMVAVPK